MQKAAFLGPLLSMRESPVETLRDHFKQNLHPKPVNIFRFHVVSRKEEIRIDAWAQLQMEWKQFKSSRGKKINFLPQSSHFYKYTPTNGPKTTLPYENTTCQEFAR